MIKYCLRNIKTNCYVVDDKDYTFYKLDINKASKFTKSRAINRIDKMKHPENWEIVKVVKE